MAKNIIGFIVILVLTSSVFAYRPFGVEDAGVAGAGVFQLETSWDYLRWGDGKSERILQIVPIYGLTDSIELSLEIPYLFHSFANGSAPQSGVGDINLAGKYLWFNEGEFGPAFTLKGVVKTESGSHDSGLGSGDRDYSIFAVASKTVGRALLHAHLGYSWVGKARSAGLRDIPLMSLGIDLPLTRKFSLLAEINGNRHPDSASADDPRVVLAGMIYKISEAVAFDLAGRIGLSKASPDWSLTTGLSATL